MKPAFLSVSLLFLVFSAACYPTSISADPIYAGASAKVITPDLDEHRIYMAGFGMNRIAEGIHDDLWARCLCIKIGDTTVAIVSVDLIGIMYPDYEEILDRIHPYFKIDQVLLTSTHNHEGPDVIGMWGPNILKSGINWEWYEEAMDIIAECVMEACYYMEPAGLKLGYGEAPGLSRDTRDPVVMDEQVESLQAVDSGGIPIGTVVFYASHVEVLWDDNTLITADFPHYLYNYIEDNGGGIAVYANGAIGGMITPEVEGHTFEEAERIGETLGEISLSSLEDAPIIRDTALRVESRRLYVAVTNIKFRLAGLIGLMDRPLYHYRRDLKTELSVVELGEGAELMQIVSIPGEDFPENWLELKEMMIAEHRMAAGLCMDDVGYIVPIEDFDWQDYEESMSASIFLDPEIHLTLEEMLTLE